MSKLDKLIERTLKESRHIISLRQSDDVYVDITEDSIGIAYELTQDTGEDKLIIDDRDMDLFIRSLNKL